MRHNLSGRARKTTMKLVVDKATQKVVGAHMLGEDARGDHPGHRHCRGHGCDEGGFRPHHRHPPDGGGGVRDIADADPDDGAGEGGGMNAPAWLIVPPSDPARGVASIPAASGSRRPCPSASACGLTSCPRCRARAQRRPCGRAGETVEPTQQEERQSNDAGQPCCLGRRARNSGSTMPVPVRSRDRRLASICSNRRNSQRWPFAVKRVKS